MWFAYLDTESLDVVGAVRSAGEVGQVELDLVPAVVQSHRHRADEWLDARRALVVTRAEPTSHVLVVQHLHRHLLLLLARPVKSVGKGLAAWSNDSD